MSWVARLVKMAGFEITHFDLLIYSYYRWWPRCFECEVCLLLRGWKSWTLTGSVKPLLHINST